MLQLTKEEVVKYRKAGLTFQEISEIHKTSKQRVYQILVGKPRHLNCLVCGKKLIKENGDGYKHCLKCAQVLHMKGRNRTRDMVRKRDKYTCQDCGFVRIPQQVRKHNRNIKGLKGRIKSLDVHHLDGLCGKKSKGYDRMKDMDKLITLCHKCHYNRPEHEVMKWKGVPVDNFT